MASNFSQVDCSVDGCTMCRAVRPCSPSQPVVAMVAWVVSRQGHHWSHPLKELNPCGAFYLPSCCLSMGLIPEQCRIVVFFYKGIVEPGYVGAMKSE